MSIFHRRLSCAPGIVAGALMLFAPITVLAAAPQARAAPPQSPVKAFTIVARQFAFEPSRITVVQGDVVRLTLRSDDVKHGLAIEGYDLQFEIPAGGTPVVVQFRATKAGQFDMSCSEYCGTGHGDMRATLIVEAGAHEEAAGGQAETGSAGARKPPANPIDVADRTIKPAEPDFTLVNLPTTLRLPRFGSAFRVTHRFSRALDDGSFGSLAADLFAFDSHAQIGLEYRFGIARGLQLGVQRTSDRTIELFSQYDVLRQPRPGPIAVNLLATVEGLNNFKQDFSPGLGVVLSHRLGGRGAVYATPMFVARTSTPFVASGNRGTAFIGLGARIRVSPSTDIVGEISPRVAGFAPGVTPASVAIEGRVGGHVFQLNFSNSLGTTAAQIARGGPTGNHWFIGFNITRKLY